MKTKHSILVPLAAQPAHRRSRGTAWRVSAAALLLLVATMGANPSAPATGSGADPSQNQPQKPIAPQVPAQRQRPNGPQAPAAAAPVAPVPGGAVLVPGAVIVQPGFGLLPAQQANGQPATQQGVGVPHRAPCVAIEAYRCRTTSRFTPRCSIWLGALDDLATSREKAAGGDKLGDRNPNYEWSPIQLDTGSRRWRIGRIGLRCLGKARCRLCSPVSILSGRERLAAAMGSAPPGNDLFLTACGLMSTGARTVLISR